MAFNLNKRLKTSQKRLDAFIEELTEKHSNEVAAAFQAETDAMHERHDAHRIEMKERIEAAQIACGIHKKPKPPKSRRDPPSDDGDMPVWVYQAFMLTNMT